MKSTLLSFFLAMLAFRPEAGLAQIKYYEDNFSGGVTSGGYSPPYNLGGTGAFTLDIAAGSTIRTAFLIAGRHGNASDITVDLNGQSYTFSAANQASPTFQSSLYGGNSGVHVIDVTGNINPAVNNYTLTVPVQPGPANRYNDFVLFVAYNNASMTTVSTVLFLNNVNFGGVMDYTLNFVNAINTSYPVALSLLTGYICDDGTDGTKVKVANTTLGTIGDNDINSGICGGPIGSFVYANNSLTGLSDDASNLSMSSSDALSDISSKISNNITSLTMRFTAVTSGNTTNAVWGVIITSGSAPTPLPVELVEFTGIAGGGINLLHWETASEVNCDYFVVERSHDDLHFHPIGKVPGSGNSTVWRQYGFTDDMPYGDVTYYRLKEVDFNGTFYYSDIVRLVSKSGPSISSVDVYTLQGQLVARTTYAGLNHVFQQLDPGGYLLYYRTADRSFVEKRLIGPTGY